MALEVTPILPVVHMDEAVEFYETAGFGVRRAGDGYAVVSYDGTHAFDLELAPEIDPARNGAGCYVHTTEADEWHARLASLHLPVDDPREAPGGREFTLTDPSGNRLRVGPVV